MFACSLDFVDHVAAFSLLHHPSFECSYPQSYEIACFKIPLLSKIKKKKLWSGIPQNILWRVLLLRGSVSHHTACSNTWLQERSAMHPHVFPWFRILLQVMMGRERGGGKEDGLGFPCFSESYLYKLCG